MDRSQISQVIMATHSPLLMAYPGARLMQLSKDGLASVRVQDTEHYRAMRDFWRDPDGYVNEVLRD